MRQVLIDEATESSTDFLVTGTLSHGFGFFMGVREECTAFNLWDKPWES